MSWLVDARMEQPPVRAMQHWNRKRDAQMAMRVLRLAGFVVRLVKT